MRSGFLHRAAAKLSRRVVHGYPKPWRDRYAGEVLALLDDSPARLRDVLDLARGLVVERVRATFEPGDWPLVLSTLVFLTGFARGVAMAAPPILAGWAAQDRFGPLPRSVVKFAALASVVLMLTVVLLFARTRSSTTMPLEPRRQLSSRAGRVYLGLAIPIMFFLSWYSTHIIQSLGLLSLFGPVWDQIAARRPWQVEMARALHSLRSARNELKWALLELERCEHLVGEGSSAALEQARGIVDRLNRQRDEALATLHGLGYRATLSRRSSA